MAQIAICTGLAPDSYGTATQSTALEAKVCNFTTYSVGDFWMRRMEAQANALFSSQRHSYRVVRSLNSGDLAPFANRYYGSFILAEAPVEPLVLSKVYTPVREHLKFKEFKARQAAGEILLSPTLNRSMRVTVNPGFPASNITGTYQLSCRHDKLFRDQFPVYPTGCRHWPNRPWDEEEGYFRGVIPGTMSNYTRYTFAGGLTVPVGAPEVNQWAEAFWSAVAGLEVDTGLVTEARSEAAAGILDLSTTMAELPETLKMIYEAIRLILAKYLEVRRKIDILKENKINEADLISQISTLWMQYRYGIMPNVYTIQDGLSYLQAEVVQYQSVRKGDGQYPLEVPPLGGWVCDPVEIVHRVFLKNRFAIENLSKSAAYLSTNLLTTAWELIPLSFVIDWVLNVGDFLSSLVAPTGSIQEAAQASWHGKNLKFTLVNPAFVQGTIDVDVGFYRADLIKPFDHIGLNVGLSMNVKRALDSMALAWGFTSSDFKRKLRRRK